MSVVELVADNYNACEIDQLYEVCNGRPRFARTPIAQLTRYSVGLQTLWLQTRHRLPMGINMLRHPPRTGV